MLKRSIEIRADFSETKAGAPDGVFLHFTRGRIVRTESIDVPGGVINLDFDADNRLSRIEVYPWETLGDNFYDLTSATVEEVE